MPGAPVPEIFRPGGFHGFFVIYSEFGLFRSSREADCLLSNLIQCKDSAIVVDNQQRRAHQAVSLRHLEFRGSAMFEDPIQILLHNLRKSVGFTMVRITTTFVQSFYLCEKKSVLLFLASKCSFLQEEYVYNRNFYLDQNWWR